MKKKIKTALISVSDKKKLSPLLNILNKNKIKKGNLLVAIPSSGLHSNGYSLVRNLIKKKKINILKNNYLKKE